MDVPVALGLANNRSEAQRLLTEQRLIPPPTKTGHLMKSLAAPLRLRIDVDTLSLYQRENWRTAQLDLIDEIGDGAWTKLRASSGEIRQQRYDLWTKTWSRLARFLEREGEQLKGKPSPCEDSAWDEIGPQLEKDRGEERLEVFLLHGMGRKLYVLNDQSGVDYAA